METKVEKAFYESRVHWGDLIMLPVLNVFFIAIPMISISLVFGKTDTKAFLIIYIILIVIGTFISVKFFIRKYIFYENRLEIVFIFREIRNRSILYDDISEVFYWRGEMPKAPNKMILKVKEGRTQRLDIEEKHAQNILLEVKKRNVPVKLKVQSIYTRFKE